MDGVPRDTLAVVDKERHRFAVRTVHVEIVLQATELVELGYSKEYYGIGLLYGIAREACLASFVFAHDNSLR